MASVSFRGVRRTYPGADHAAVAGLDLEVADGELMVLLGLSGCGKSTVLRMLAGLEEVSEGRVLIGDRDVTTAPAREREVAMVFQNYALYPHLSVADNMGTVQVLAGLSPAEVREQVEGVAGLLGLTGHLDRLPEALSGVERQRVAIGRAVVRRPKVLGMDEPLSNLHAEVREQTRADLVRLCSEVGVTTILVTHDPAEALAMGDRVAVLDEGVLLQCAAPQVLREEPVTPRVELLLGGR